MQQWKWTSLQKKWKSLIHRHLFFAWKEVTPSWLIPFCSSKSKFLAITLKLKAVSLSESIRLHLLNGSTFLIPWIQNHISSLDMFISWWTRKRQLIGRVSLRLLWQWLLSLMFQWLSVFYEQFWNPLPNHGSLLPAQGECFFSVPSWWWAYGVGPVSSWVAAGSEQNVEEKGHLSMSWTECNWLSVALSSKLEENEQSIESEYK